jgi:hypothetical protein
MRQATNDGQRYFEKLEIGVDAIKMTTGGVVTVCVGVVETKRFRAIVFARSATRRLLDKRIDLPQSHWIRRRLQPV